MTKPTTPASSEEPRPGAITARESKALLYAAQVAQSALREPPPPDPKRY